MSIIKPTAFTLRGKGGRLNMLVTPANIHISGNPSFRTVNAIWDTGASGSAITKEIADKLDLAPTGFAQVHTANGLVTQKTYLIDIGVNAVIIEGITATEVDGLSGGL